MDSLEIIELFYRIQMDLEHHTNLKALAEKSGVSESTVYNWAAGKVSAPRLDTLNKVGTALGYRIMLVKQ